MTNKEVVLCADAESLKDPRLVGLGGENLETQKWLRVFCSAIEARRYLRNAEKADEVWVASSDEVDAINLAAALKKDSKGKGVYLVAFQGTGSLKSRANAAGIDGTLSHQDFLRRYGSFKSSSTCGGLTGKGAYESVADFGDSQYKNTLTETRGSIDSLSNRASSEKSAQVLSIVSASGGSGKSTVSALSAVLSQGLGYRTLLLDADLQFGDVQHFLGMENALTIDRIMEDPALIDQLKPGDSLPALLAPPKNLEQSEQLAAGLPRLIEDLKAHFDVIIVNTGAFWSDQHVSLLERSSTALFLIDQRSSSVRACKHALDLCARCGMATHPFLFAINRCSRVAPLTSIDVSCALQGSHAVELQEGGREVSDLLSAGLPLELVETRNDFCLSLEQMLIDLLPQFNRTVVAKNSVRQEGRRFRIGRKRKRVACL